MTTLAQMRTLVRQMLDDAIEGEDGTTDDDEHRWSKAEIDFALEAALEVILSEFARRSTRLDVTAEFTTSSGAVDLSALDILEIKGVEYKHGSVYVPLSAGDHSSPTVEGFNGTLRITYVAKPTFPAIDATEITYGAGSAVGLKSLDRLIARQAALDLKPKEGEQNRGLEEQQARDWEAVLRIGGVPRAREIRLSGPAWDRETTYFSGEALKYRWVWVPGTESLRLVV